MTDMDRKIADAIARAKAMTAAERAAEEARQTADITHRIIESINQAMASYDVPIGNAIGPALVAAEAKWLAALNPDDRRKAKRSMDAMRPRFLVEAIRNTPISKVIKVGVAGFDA